MNNDSIVGKKVQELINKAHEVFRAPADGMTLREAWILGQTLAPLVNKLGRVLTEDEDSGNGVRIRPRDF